MVVDVAEGRLFVRHVTLAGLSEDEMLRELFGCDFLPKVE
jgi:hypothetical protein